MKIRGNATTELINLLKTRWLDLCLNLSCDEQIKISVFNSLVTLYSEPHRDYHNLKHIHNLLGWFEKFRINIIDFQTLGLAIWFHDVIYDPRRSDNEEQSANLAVGRLKYLKVLDRQTAMVRQMILATKTHDSTGLDCDGKLFLDLDLSILGADALAYQAYSRAIRKEYSFVPEPLYRNGRERVLQSFLSRKFIYLTDACREKFELQARENIKKEIVELSK
jgi:predicted metal-dependent HD superfamily phosphohydrolase